MQRLMLPSSQMKKERALPAREAALWLSALLQKAIARPFPKTRKNSCCFMGRPGLGKSYLLACMCKKLYERERDICYLGSYALFEQFHKDRLGEGAMLEPVYDAKVLVIDDLGSEPLTQNVTREYFFDLLCARARAGLHTFMATNNTYEQLKERYTERVSSPAPFQKAEPGAPLFWGRPSPAATVRPEAGWKIFVTENFCVFKPPWFFKLCFLDAPVRPLCY